MATTQSVQDELLKTNYGIAYSRYEFLRGGSAATQKFIPPISNPQITMLVRSVFCTVLINTTYLELSSQRNIIHVA
jgi:hypothetical protein